MNMNYLGIAAAILVFVSVVLPWWTIATSNQSYNISIYLYRASRDANGDYFDSPNTWYCQSALILLIIAGLTGLVGSIVSYRFRGMLAIGGSLVLASLVIFASGLQNFLSQSFAGGIGLFSQFQGDSGSVTTYLTFGFWTALVATILMFVAIIRRPKSSTNSTASVTRTAP